MRFVAVALLSFAAFLHSPYAFAADATAGEKVFNKCRPCHQVGATAKNGVGPELNGLFGRKAGSVEGFNYSAAYRALDKVWDETNFATYIRDPKSVTPGTKMPFAGLKNDDEIANLTAFLKQFDASGKKLP